MNPPVEKCAFPLFSAAVHWQLRHRHGGHEHRQRQRRLWGQEGRLDRLEPHHAGHRQDHVRLLPTHHSHLLGRVPGRRGGWPELIKTVSATFLYTMGHPLSRDVLLFSFGSSGYQLVCTITAVSAKRPVEHVKTVLQNIETK